MSTFELKKTSLNEYPSVLKEEILKGLSFKIFHGLEDVVKCYEDLVFIEQEYSDQKSAWSNHLVRGKLIYKSFKDQEKKDVLNHLEIQLVGGFKRSSGGALEGGYNQIDVQFYSNTKEVNTKVVADLIGKFKSFEELIRNWQEKYNRLIFSEE